MSKSIIILMNYADETNSVEDIQAVIDEAKYRMVHSSPYAYKDVVKEYEARLKKVLDEKDL